MMVDGDSLCWFRMGRWEEEPMGPNLDVGITLGDSSRVASYSFDTFPSRRLG
jgi:hypothetical protein